MTPEQVAIYRSMQPAQRLRLAFRLHDFAYRRVASAIRRERRHLTERELRLETLRRFVGEPGSVLREGAPRA